MEIWAGFIIGLVGGFHCIGMCGPIVIALPTESGKFRFLFGRLLYNFGRIVTYSILGLFSGFAGERIAVAGYQSSLSIAVGLLILILVFTPGRIKQRFSAAGVIAPVSRRVKMAWGRLFGVGSISSFFAIGILNGFLPCGLVYIALAGAIAIQSPLGGMVYMAAFGLGTIPLLFALSLLGNMVGLRLKRAITRLIPVGAIILATLFILRGLSLGIPYVSPKKIVKSSGSATMECCTPAKEDPDTTSGSGQ